MSKTWRIHAKTEESVSQEEIFEYFIKEGIVGIGWPIDKDFKENYLGDKNNSSAIRDYTKKWLKDNKRKTKGFSSNTNILVDRMEEGDYVWTRSDGKYYLGKIISKSLYNLGEIDDKYKIGFYRKIEYMKEFLIESQIPGKIIASFRSPSSAQNIDDDNEILWKYSDFLYMKKTFKIQEGYWKSMLDAYDIEELVGLYLQIEKKLFIYLSTYRDDTPLIECEMVDSLGKKYGVQVKSGHSKIDSTKYIALSEKMKIYLFTISDSIILPEKGDIEIITTKQIEEFMRKHKMLLPERIANYVV